MTSSYICSISTNSCHISTTTNTKADNSTGYRTSNLTSSKQSSTDNIISPVFSTSNNNIESSTIELLGDSYIGALIIVNGNKAQAQNGSADVYFSYLGANNDNFDHIKLLDTNTLGFEDLANGGDQDFNDIIIKFDNKAT